MASPARPWRPPRRLKITRAGRWYIALTLGVGAAALNTGNNLLFLVLGLLLAGILLSGFLSEWALQRIRVERRLPSSARAGETSLVGLVARNGNRFWSSFSLVVEDRGEDDAVVRGKVFFLKVGAQETRESAYSLKPEHRGELKFGSVKLLTRFPFGLFEKSREVDLEATLVVWPRRVPAPRYAPRSAGPESEEPTRRQNIPGADGELRGLRDFRSGDNARLIHWKASARHQKLIVAERERPRRRRLVIVVDNRGDPADADGVRLLDSRVERAAALAERHASEGGEIGLATSGALLAPAAGPGQLRAVVSALACLGTSRDGPAPHAPRDAAVMAIS